MSEATEDRLLHALDRTWPAARLSETGGFVIREGRGGGKRVSAATATGTAADIPAAEAAMTALGQPRLFMIRAGEAVLDRALDRRGYRVIDPVTLYRAPVATLTGPVPQATGFAMSVPLAIMRDIWAGGGIGPGRLAVMARATHPRTTLFARIGNLPAGVGFVACDGDVAMLHALEVVPQARRKGVGRQLVRQAANWANLQGARWLALAVTRDNRPANRLYAGLSMAAAGRYHYRIWPKDKSGD